MSMSRMGRSDLTGRSTLDDLLLEGKWWLLMISGLS